jgi:dGTP triphosphohydrolase
VTNYREFQKALTNGLQGDEICLPRAGLNMLEDLEGFLEGKVRRGHDFDQVDGKARRVLLGLFASYFAEPGLLKDHLLIRYKEIAGGRFLRDVPASERTREIDTRYRGRSFVRLLADHLAAMTDTYALTEYRRLIQEGAVPIPSAEQLRRET